MTLGNALCMAGHYEEAIKALKKARHLNPKDVRAMVGLAITYSLSGRDDEAKALVPEILIIYPSFSIKEWEMRVPFKKQADTKFAADVMRKIGLPE